MAFHLDSSPLYYIAAHPSSWYPVNNPLTWVLGGASTASQVVRVTLTDKTSGAFYQGIYPQYGGIFTIRLDTVLKELVTIENTCIYSHINDKEENISSIFGIKFELGTVTAGTFEMSEEIVETFHYVLHSVRQVGCQYGSNMADYITIHDGSNKAKFLTFFVNPRFWEGYPFTLDFIWSHGTTDPTVVSDDGTLTTLTDYDQRVNHIKLKGGYSDDEIPVLITTGSSTVIQLTETKMVKVQHFDDRNTLYLRWINELAGTDHWLFNVNQIKKISITDQKVAKLDVLDLISAIGTHQTRSSRKVPMYSIGTEPLTANEWDVLSQQLGGTLYCQVYNQTLSKWYNALVVPADYERNTKMEPYKIEFNIILPEIFNQSL